MQNAFHNLGGLSLHRVAGVAACLLLHLVAPPVLAETIEVRLPSGVTASANFHAGLPTRPAVLIMHGFLQTNLSPPMNPLASNLASRGYSVLAPTLSLGVNRRSQSMACDAVHTHTMEGDVAEMDFWVNWLRKKAQQDIVLIGFSSSGNIAVLAYNAHGPHTGVSMAMLTNLNPMYSERKQRQQTRASPSEKQLARFNLGFCKKSFTATAKSYLSYAKYDEDMLLDLLKTTPVRTEVILGTADSVLPENWAARIQGLQSKVQVHTIQDANHFFDGTSEFDLSEKIETILQNMAERQ